MTIIRAPQSRDAINRQNALLKRCYLAQCDLEAKLCDLSVQQIARAQHHIARARIIALFGKEQEDKP